MQTYFLIRIQPYAANLHFERNRKTANYVGHTPILPYDFIYMLSGNVWTDNSGVVFQRIGELLSFLWSYFVVCFLVFLYYKIMKKNMH